jgi:excinuclease ABC subunit C
MVAAVASVEALVCGSRHEAAWLERNVLEGAALPPWNRTPGGQETPAVIVLDRRRPRPRLVVAHLPHEPIAGGSIFGPFLGGLQVRRAVAGLHRLYPLALPAPGSAAPNERWPSSAALPSVTETPSPTH